MPGKTEYIPADSIQYQVLLPLLYFEIFSYPLTFDEIKNFSCTQKINIQQIKSAIDLMVKRGVLFNIEHYYLTQNRPDWVDARKDNNSRADKYIHKAHFMTRIIRRFPFVRAVLLSGSLSKRVMPKGGDIDYFIITHPNRLWIARTFLVVFKKLFLFNSKKYFCVNYFVDEQHLEIEEQNRFTATEVATLLPVYSRRHYDHFHLANQWIRNFFPHYPKQAPENIRAQKPSKIQRLTEYLLNGSFGDMLDNWFMTKTISYWCRKFSEMDPESFSVALKSKRYVSKHHPQNFQKKVQAAFQDRVRHFEERNNVKMDPVSFSL